MLTVTALTGVASELDRTQAVVLGYRGIFLPGCGNADEGREN